MRNLLSRIAANPYVRHAAVVFASVFATTMVATVVASRTQLDVAALWGAAVAAAGAAVSAVVHWAAGLLASRSGQPVGLPWRGRVLTQVPPG